MGFTVKRSAAEMVVRQRAPALPLAIGASAYGGVVWLLWRDPSVDGLFRVSLIVAGATLACLAYATFRHPSEVVLDRARNRIRVRFLPGTSRFDFEAPLHELSRIDLIDVGTAVYSSLVRADRLAPAAAWSNAFPSLKEWAFRTSSEESRFDAEHSWEMRIARLLRREAAAKPVRLRVTMRNGEEIALDRLTAAPDRLRSLAGEMEEFAGVAAG